MSIEIEMKDPPKPFTIVSARKMVPLRVAEIRSLVCTSNKAREEAVRKDIEVGDICVSFRDEQTYWDRILHCRSGILLPGYYCDYLLFEYALDVKRVVIAKPEN